MTDLAPYAAVILDLVAWDPDLRPSLERDFLRLATISSTRGVSFLTEDMPAAGRIFDKGLSCGWFDRFSLPSTFGPGVKKNDRGYFLKQLLGKVFESDGSIRFEVDPQYVFFIRQILYLSKKLKLPHSKETESKAVDEFVRIETEMRRPTLEWDLDELTTHRRIDHLSFLDGYRFEPDLVSHRDTIPKPLLRTLDAVCERVVNLFPAFDWRELTPRHGPGAVCDVRTGSDKYQFPFWPRKLDLVFPYEYFAQHREDLHLYVDKPRSHHEPFAKLSAVPKDMRGPRLITVEPVAHQYLQQALLAWFRNNLPQPLRLCIDFADQTKSQRLSLESSATGDLATVDLSSASDRLSCWSVERVFCRHKHGIGILSALHASRTRGLRISLGGRRDSILLRKYAGQGNATTFPIQSIFYSLVAIAALLFDQKRSPSYNNICWAAGRIQVFGDDIIMPSFAVGSLVELLSYCGLKVNMAKSHITGKFRESCGTDAFDGVDVTPLYMRYLSLGESSDELVSWVDVSNNAYFKGLWTLSSWMVDQLPDKIRKLIPIAKTQQSCLTLLTHQDSTLYSSRRRYNVHLQRHEFLALQGVSKTVSKRREENEGLLQYFLEAPAPDFLGIYPKWEAKFLVRNRSLLKRRWVSPL